MPDYQSIESLFRQAMGLTSRPVAKDKRVPMAGVPHHAVETYVAKLLAADASWEAANVAVQTFGGYGYCKEQRVERLFRDARLGEIGEGTSEIQRILIAKDLIRKYAA